MANRKNEDTNRINGCFVRNLDKVLSEKGWSRSKLKNLSGVSLERYKEGEDMRGASLVSAVKIADALDVSLDMLCNRYSHVRDFDELNAGECLDLLVKLSKRIGASFSAVTITRKRGLSIELPDSTLTRAIRPLLFPYMNYMLIYESEIDENGNAPSEPPPSEWFDGKLQDRINYLKENKVALQIFPHGPDESSPILQR